LAIYSFNRRIITSMITGKILKLNGWPDGKIIGLAKAAAEQLEAGGFGDRDSILAWLDSVRQNPGNFLADPLLADLARECLRLARRHESKQDDTLRILPLQYRVWGEEHIDGEAMRQMDSAMRLPVSAAGALMPDAHVGYGLPIGGVLATQDTVIPYAVGVDIACFAGDTKVPLLDGNDYTLAALAKRTEPFYVYACKPDGKIVIALATAIKIKESAELVEVTIDSGEKILCTPEHEFMLRDGAYQKASELAAGQSLMPFYSQRDLVHGITGKLSNHKVVSVQSLEERQGVYCLVVPHYHNFALSAGVFVHNCRMRLSIYEVSPHLIGQKQGQFEKSLLEQTQFGMGAEWKGSRRAEHAVLDDPAWSATRLLRSLQDNARRQLGTSGTGNHFVEWGAFSLKHDAPELGLTAGEYLALLSHSGSRSVGFKIADFYSKMAMEKHPGLDKSARHLSWLTLDSEEGQEYWLSMELAGRFASANHYVIHHRVAAAVGLKELVVVENHHNFAWIESLPDGRNVIVHRKGATPAGPGVLGVIPGSMGDAGYVVRGKGLADSLNSASHGAGRQMSRKAAIHSITKTARDAYLRERGITLLGGGLDESPQAYKPIESIIAAQGDLVEIIGKFTPRLVRMADEPGDI
jgi:tRNA-splicing ligase RtcB